MGQRLGDGFVGVFQLRVLAHDSNAHLALGVVDAVGHVFPDGQVGLGCRADLECVENGLVQPLAVIGQGRLVDRRKILRRDHGVGPHVAEKRQLLTLLRGDRPLGAADEDIGRDADRAQFLHRMLRGLRLQLSAGLDIGQQRQVHEDALAARLVLAELADRLEEGQPLDVADGAADLAEHEVDLILADRDEILDLVGDVGNHLDGLAEVVAAPLLLEHVGVDPARRDRVGHPRRHAREALVMPEVEVGFRPVIGDEDLAMLERRHRSGVYVQVGVELAQPDSKTPRLQKRAEGGRGQTLAKRRDHTAGDENETRHGCLISRAGCAALIAAVALSLCHGI